MIDDAPANGRRGVTPAAAASGYASSNLSMTHETSRIIFTSLSTTSRTRITFLRIMTRLLMGSRSGTPPMRHWTVRVLFRANPVTGLNSSQRNTYSQTCGHLDSYRPAPIAVLSIWEPVAAGSFFVKLGGKGASFCRRLQSSHRGVRRLRGANLGASSPALSVTTGDCWGLLGTISATMKQGRLGHRPGESAVMHPGRVMGADGG